MPSPASQLPSPAHPPLVLQAISWALNRGPLCMPGLTPIQFLAVYAAPITPVAPAGGPASEQPHAGKAGAAGVQSTGSGSAATQQADEPPEGGRVAEAYRAQRMPRVGSQGRLGEDAGSSGSMLLSWLGKLALIVVMVWVMQQPLPGLARSFAYGALAGGRRAFTLACHSARHRPPLPAFIPARQATFEPVASSGPQNNMWQNCATPWQHPRRALAKLAA